MRRVVLGVDSSTQSTKVIALDLETGEEVGIGRASHTGADIQDPEDWWAALRAATHVAVTDRMEVAGIAVAGQQHGLVTLDAENQPVRPAPLWNNVAAAPDAGRLNGLADFAAEVGSRLVASFTIAKLAHLARTAPESLARTASICLPHDFVTFRLTDRLISDRSDASGTGWWSPREARSRRDLLAFAVGPHEAERIAIPHVAGPQEAVGELTAWAAAELGLQPGIPVGPGAGDNAGAALGIGATDRELVISLGTSGVAYAVSGEPTSDPTGEVCGFADATGRFLPLACMLNCTRVVDRVGDLLGIERVAALDRAATEEPGAEGLLLVPYLAGERTPDLPLATGSLLGVNATNLRPETFLRAAVDGVAAGLAYLVEAMERLGIRKPVVTLVGGGSQHPAWQQAIADATGLPVSVRGGHEHVARGAATQIAAIVRGEPLRDLVAAWRPHVTHQVGPRPELRERFQLARRRALIEEGRTRQHLP